MSIHGPLPPSSIPPSYSQGDNPQLSAHAQAILATQLADIASLLLQLSKPGK
jgi:hypothetical protein